MENIIHGDQEQPPHVAIIPSADMGHLTPCLHLAAMLAAQGCTVTLVTVHPMVSSSESLRISCFFSSTPQQIRPLPFHLLPLPPSFSCPDPFFLHVEAMRRFAHLLPSLLGSVSPPLYVLITDIMLGSTFSSLSLPFSNYIFFTSSTAMHSFFAIYLSPLPSKRRTSKFPASLRHSLHPSSLLCFGILLISSVGVRARENKEVERN